MSMDYDPTSRSLYHPETRAPFDMTGWSADAVCAEFSRLAYFRFESDAAQREAVAAAIAGIGYRGMTCFDDSRDPATRFRMDAQGFGAATGDGRAIVAFRGTQADSFRDLVADASFFPVRWPGPGHVHGGFWRALESILPQVEPWLATLGAVRLTITGHSLGAAMATLLAARHPGAELVTFGSPLVGDNAFAAAFSGRPVRRYVDCTDAVTLVPPPPYFVHLDGLRYIDAAGKVHHDLDGVPSLMLDHAKAYADYAPLMWDSANVHLRGLADHTPVNYLASVLGVRAGP